MAMLIWYMRNTRCTVMSDESEHIEHDWEFRYALKPGDIFLEAGAFWGRYGWKASRKVGPCGRVILIEPSPQNADVIREGIKRSGCFANITVIQKAVTDKWEWCDDFIAGGINPAGCRFPYMEGDERFQDRIRIETDTIDHILTTLEIEHVDLLACDVENCEVPLVRGAKQYLSTHRIKHVALAAYHWRGNPETIMEILKGHDYEDIEYAYTHTYERSRGIVFAHV